MGKAKGKGGSSAAGAAAAPKKCTCDHPFQCDCGNRPERPSKGHKWYPDDQVWAGKGHKQKGASGQVASVSQQATITKTGQTSVAQWQRLPSQLLDEVCQRQSRPRPVYKRVVNGGDNNSSFKYRVILPDAKKDRDKDLIFVPAHAVANEEQAKEEGALVALLQLTPSLPHERKLPEPYKTTWLNAIQSLKSNNAKTKTQPPDNIKQTPAAAVGTASPSSSIPAPKPTPATTTATTAAATASSNLTLGSSYTSLADKRQQIAAKRQAQNARIRKHEAVRMANQNHPVFMSAAMRLQVERLLRSGSNSDDPAALGSGGDGGDTEPDEDDEENSDLAADSNDAKMYVVHRLHNEGFAKRQAQSAWKELERASAMFQKHASSANGAANETEWDRMYEECLQWLLVHLNEEQLPEGFDPRGRTLDVLAPVVAPQKASSTTVPTVDEASRNEATSTDHFEFASRYGVSVREATLLSDLAAEKKIPIVDLFWQTLQTAADIVKQADISSDVIAANEQDEMVEEEMEALVAIFDSGCTIAKDSDKGVSTVRIALEGASLTLEVVIRSGQYPSSLPLRALLMGKWPAPNMGVHVHVALVKFLQDLPLGEPMIFAMHTFAQDLVQSNNSQPPLTLVPFLTRRDSSDVPPLPSATIDKACTPQQRNQPEVEKPIEKSLDRKQQLPQQAHRPRRPREGGRTFWSMHPRDTPPAVAFPKVGYLMEQTRKSLPAANARSDFLTAMKTAKDQGTRVVLVSGATGSGKTTQLPAYLLEDNPKGAKIIVVQPRRLAATGVANRVAEERGEKRAGVDSVGYVVRGDSAICKSSRLVFCTTGVLLRQLQNEGALDCLTTIVVDEVHERNLDGDILLGLLKQLLPGYPHLSVVLMSATLELERFSNYWGSSPVPHVHIPGRTFPVVDFTLEDVLRLTGYIPSKNKKKSKYKSNRPRRSSPWNDSEKSDNEEEAEGDSPEHEEESAPSVPQHNVPIDDLVKRIDETSPDMDLICRLVKYVVTHKEPGDDGSILVFLAGAPEIGNALETIKRGLKDLPITPLPLHGGLQPKDQNRVFQPAQRGFTKVVLSTNVAETSVTIPDCTVVIDTCREKQASYDPVNRMPQLLEQFASKAALKQRRGRAGRVREGTCYKLISKGTHDALRDHSEPEIRRVALDQTLLQLIFLGVERGPGTFTSTLLDPPSAESMEAATFSLRKLGAVESIGAEGELSLTPLGEHLAGIPAPPTVGKMLVMGSILGCREAALAMAAGMSVGRSPFLRVDSPRDKSGVSTFGKSESTDETKQRRILEQRAILIKEIGNSDHALLAAVFLKWQATEIGRQNKFCDEFGLSYNVLRDMAQLARQLDSSLVAAGFPSSKTADLHQSSLRIIHTCAVSAMAPSQLVKVRRPATKYQETAEGAREKDGEAKELSFFVRTDDAIDEVTGRVKDERVFIHPSSINFHNGNYSCPFLVYHSMVRTSKPFLRDVTECSAYALLLFGGELEIKASKGVVIVDGWVELAANARIGSLMGGLRRRMDSLLTDKIKDPSMDISTCDEMKLIVKLIVTDGLGT